MTSWSSHFNRQHPLVTVADARCRAAGHDAADRIGGACGACWEHAIRRDERAAAALDPTGDPGELVPVLQQQVLTCGACGAAYSSETKYQQCVVVDRKANKRLVAPQHHWRRRADRSA